MGREEVLGCRGGRGFGISLVFRRFYVLGFYWVLGIVIFLGVEFLF